jgi:hypothetical protein
MLTSAGAVEQSNKAQLPASPSALQIYFQGLPSAQPLKLSSMSWLCVFAYSMPSPGKSLSQKMYCFAQNKSKRNLLFYRQTIIMSILFQLSNSIFQI